MIRRPYITETALNPGTGAVQGSAESKVKAPGAGGAGDFIGVYAYEANAAKEIGDQVGIQLTGIAKVLAGGNVTAGKKAVLMNDVSGRFVNVPTAVGRYPTVGVFLQSGAVGEFVDLLIERDVVTITA